MYKFSLQIDDDNHTLSADNGISIDMLSKLLEKLNKAINSDDSTIITLSEIRGNCYAMDFSSEHERDYKRFEIIHKNISQVSYIDLEPEVRDYAKTLKHILGGKYYIKALDQDRNEIVKIKDIGKDDSALYYFDRTDIYGVVSQLGAPKLSASRKSISIDGFTSKIFISGDQDLKLKQYYGTDKLRIKLKLKRSSIDGHIINAEMISFQPVSNQTLSEKLSETPFIELNFMKGVETIDDIVNRIYGTNR